MYWVSVGNGKVLYSQDEINSNHNPYNHSHHKSHRVIPFLHHRMPPPPIPTSCKPFACTGLEGCSRSHSHGQRRFC